MSTTTTSIQQPEKKKSNPWVQSIIALMKAAHTNALATDVTNAFKHIESLKDIDLTNASEVQKILKDCIDKNGSLFSDKCTPYLEQLVSQGNVEAFQKEATKVVKEAAEQMAVCYFFFLRT